MSLNIYGVYVANPITSNLDTDLMYFGQSPYLPGNDAGMTFGNFKIQFLRSSSIGVTVQAWSAVLDSVTAGTYTGSTSITTLGTITSGTWHASVISEIYGGTNQSSYALGDTLYASAANTLSKLSGNITTNKRFLSQTGTGAISAAPVWSSISGGDITGAALTKTDDTNVTLTLGGSPSTALLNATSLTLGWTGQLSAARGGTGVSNAVSSTITLGGSVVTGGKFNTTGAFDLNFTLTGTTSLTLPTSGTLIASAGALTTGSVLFSTAGVIDQDNANFFWNSTNHNIGIGTNTLNSNALVNFGGNKGVGIYDTMVKNGSITGVQVGYYDSATYASASSYGQVGTIFSAPIITIASGQTVTNFASVISQPVFSGNVGTVTKFAGFMFLAAGTSGATGTLTATYGAYLETPLAGTARAGLYAGNAAIGYVATSAPASGLIVSGNTSIGSSSTTSLFNVGSSNQFQIGTTGIVTSGTWNGGVIAANYGGTGVANAAGSTITLGGALSTIGAFTAAFTMTGNTAVTFPTSGTLLTSASAVSSAVGTANQIAVSASVGTVTFSLTNGISLGSYQATTPPTGGMFIPGSVSIGSTTATSMFNVGTNQGFQVASSGYTQITGSNGFGFSFIVQPTVNAGSNVVVTPVGIYPTININSINATYISAVEVVPVVTVSNTLTLPVGYGQYFKAWSKTGAGTATKLTTLRVEAPSGGTTNYCMEIGTLSQLTISNLGVLTTIDGTFLGVGCGSSAPTTEIYAFRASSNPIISVQRGANSIFGIQCDSDLGIRMGVYSGGNISNQLYVQKAGSVVIGSDTAATTSLLSLFSSTQVSSRLTLTGAQYTSSTTSTDGVALVLYNNGSGNRQMAFADSAALTRNTTNNLIRIGIGTSLSSPFIDSISTDGSTPFALNINNSGGSVAFCGTASYGGGVGVLFVANATTIPTTNPSSGGILYSQGGAGKWRGGGGTVTTFGPANPHCPNCSSDFVHEWESEIYGYLVKCMLCAANGINSFSTVKGSWDINEPQPIGIN